MYSSFSLDLKTARRASGLSQSDCGHLLGVDQKRISAFECGKRLPSVTEICALSIIFGRSFESLFGAIFADVRGDLVARLATLPKGGSGWLGRFKRQNTLNRIADALSDNPLRHG